MLDKLKKWLSYPELNKRDLNIYHRNKEFDKDKLTEIYRFRGNVFLFALVLLLIFYLIDFLLF